MNNNKHTETLCLKRPSKIDGICQVTENQLPNDYFPCTNVDNLKEIKKWEMSGVPDISSLITNPLIIGKKDDNLKGFEDRGKPWIKSVINIKRKIPPKNNVLNIKPTKKINIKRQESEDIIKNPLINVKIKHKKAISNVNEQEHNSTSYKLSRNKLEKLIARNYPFLVYTHRNNSYLPRYLNPIMNLNTIINTSKIQDNELPQIEVKSLSNFNNPYNNKSAGKTISSFHLTERSEKNNTLTSFNKPVLKLDATKKLTNPLKVNLNHKDKITIFSKKSNKL
jgi:hypothetical protein